MALSPFFCQNQLSDYLDGLLPASRADEIKKTLSDDAESSSAYQDLCRTIEICQQLPHRPLSHELALRITEGAQSGRRRRRSRQVFSRAVLFVLAPVLVFGSVLLAFPESFPWVQQLQRQPAAANFVRYFPMLQGAEVLIEEQANWLRLREPAKLSVWEEGGLSPEEFEKSFQLKSPVLDENDAGL